ncbi:MAG: phage tail tape measure protein [Firmicutes bacterium]|nr:phage tail tape measure protein [Bacillota bacterium]
MAGQKVVIDIVAQFKDNATGRAKRANAALRSLTNRRHVVRLDANESKFLRALRKSEALARRFGATKTSKVLDVIDKASQPILRVEARAKAFGRGVYQAWLTVKDSNAMKAITSVGSKLKSLVGKTWKITLAAGIGAGLLTSFGIVDSVNTFKDFQAGMSQVQAVSGATAAELDILTAKAKEMGATTKFTATESAQAFNYMAMAGWKSKDMLGGIEGVLSLAAASGTDLGTTSDIVTDAMTAFGMQADQAGHFSDVLAAASSNANTNVSMMGETFKYVGTMAGSLGYSIEDVSLAVGLMANTGLKGSMAGTSLNTIMTRLATNTKGAADAVKDLGVEFYNQDGSARKLADVMGELRTATAGMSAEEKSSLAKTVAGVEAQKGLLAILNASAADYNKLSVAINSADGAAGAMADTMLDNLQGSLTLLSSAVDGVKISFGERLAPYVRQIAEWFTSMTPAIEKALSGLMDSVDEKIDSMKTKFKYMIKESDKWKDADLFGKAKILWDAYVAEPFSEWWDNKGRSALVGKAADLGKAIGEGALKGIGMFVKAHPIISLLIGGKMAGSFAGSFKGLFGGRSTTGSGITGSSSTDRYGVANINITSANINVLGATSGIGSVGGARRRSTRRSSEAPTTPVPATPLFQNTLAGKLGTGIISRLPGTALNGGAVQITRGLAKGKTLSAGLASGLGLGAAAGGIAAGATVISAVKDINNSIKATNAYDKKYNAVSATSKLAGVGAGAAIGSVILPGAGTLIGAGIGGLAGWLASDKAAKAFSKNADKYSMYSKKAAEAVAELKQEQEELAAVSLADHFGTMSLSANEVTKSVEKLIGTAKIEKFNEMSTVLEDVTAAFETVDTAANSLKKNMWYATLNRDTKLAKSDMENLAESAKLYSDSVKSAMTESQRASEKSISHLLGDSEAAAEVLANNRSFYDRMSGGVDKLSKELASALNNAMSDGVISIDEQKSIDSIRAKIESISSYIKNNGQEGDKNLLKAKLAGDVDFDSFKSIMEEAHNKANELDAQLEEEFAKASIGIAQGSKEWFDLSGGLYKNQAEGHLPAFELGLDEVKEKYSKDLGDFGGSLDTVLAKYKENSYKFGEEAGKLPEETRAAVGEMVDSLAPDAKVLEGLKSKYDEVFKGFEKLGLEVPAELKSSYDNIVNQLDKFDYLKALSKGPTELKEWMEGYNKRLAAEKFEFEVKSTIIPIFEGKSNIKPQDFGIPQYMAGDPIKLALSAAAQFAKIGEVTADDFGTPDSVSKNVAVEIFGKANIMNRVNITPASFGIPTTLSANVGVALNAASYLASSTKKTAYRGGLFKPERYAAGGKVAGGARLVTVAEEGTPEMIIPLGAHRRQRGLELWQQAGEYLGVKGYAKGGIVGGTEINGAKSSDNTVVVDSGSGKGVNVNIGNITIEVKMQDGQTASEAMGENMEEIANDIFEIVVAKLNAKLANTPLKAGA